MPPGLNPKFRSVNGFSLFEQYWAYTGAEIDSQLEDATRGFLADSSRGLRLDERGRRLLLSPIFKWYAGDFTGATGAVGYAKAAVSGQELLGFVREYAPAEAVRFVDERAPSVGYLDYDWSLNSTANHARPAERRP